MRRKIIVVSNSFEIPAASARVKDNFGGDIIHRLCHEVFRQIEPPCENCAVKDTLAAGPTARWVEQLCSQNSCWRNTTFPGEGQNKTCSASSGTPNAAGARSVRELPEFSRQTRHLMGPHDMNRAISRTFFYLRIKAFFKISLSKKPGRRTPARNSGRPADQSSLHEHHPQRRPGHGG